MGVGAVAIAASVKPVRQGVIDVFKRGSKLTSSSWFTGGQDIDQKTAKSRFGFIKDTPSALLREASINYGTPLPIDVYAGARMVRSEGASEGVLRMHVALNDLQRFPHANNLHELLTYSTDPKRKGFFGKQYSPAAPPLYPQANRRRFATGSDPYSGDVDLVLQVLAERRAGIDKAHGATKFIDVDDMGHQEGSVSFAQKDAEWKGDGYKAFTTEEFGPNFVLYRKA